MQIHVDLNFRYLFVIVGFTVCLLKLSCDLLYYTPSVTLCECEEPYMLECNIKNVCFDFLAPGKGRGTQFWHCPFIFSSVLSFCSNKFNTLEVRKQNFMRLHVINSYVCRCIV